MIMEWNLFPSHGRGNARKVLVLIHLTVIGEFITHIVTIFVYINYILCHKR